MTNIAKSYPRLYQKDEDLLDDEYLVCPKLPPKDGQGLSGLVVRLKSHSDHQMLFKEMPFSWRIASLNMWNPGSPISNYLSGIRHSCFDASVLWAEDLNICAFSIEKRMTQLALTIADAFGKNGVACLNLQEVPSPEGKWFTFFVEALMEKVKKYGDEIIFDVDGLLNSWTQTAPSKFGTACLVNNRYLLFDGPPEPYKETQVDSGFRMVRYAFIEKKTHSGFSGINAHAAGFNHKSHQKSARWRDNTTAFIVKYLLELPETIIYAAADTNVFDDKYVDNHSELIKADVIKINPSAKLIAGRREFE